MAKETHLEERILLRGREVAELLGISRALAFRWMQRGVLPTVRMPGSRTVRVPREALLRFLAQRTRQGGE
jgi:excisionase family DNA binding protein